MRKRSVLSLAVLIALLLCCSSDDGPVCTSPSKPTAPCEPYPASGARGVPPELILSWNCGDCACGLKVTYDVYLGTKPDAPLICSGLTVKTCDPGILELGSHYFWRVVARSPVGSITGRTWSFEIEEEPCTGKPTRPGIVYPDLEEDSVSVETDLAWDGGWSRCGYPVAFDVYFGNSAEPPLVCSACSARTFDPGTLEYETEYFWQVIAEDSAGSNSGGLWSFKTESPCTEGPTVPCMPTPRSGSYEVPLEPVLTWECGESRCDLPVTYDIYFGEEQAGLELVCSDCTTRTYVPRRLDRSTIYTWQVVAEDANGHVSHGVWAFRTVDGRPRSWHIEPDGSGDAPTIQAGVDLAAHEDTLLLADGLYRGPGNRGILVREASLVIRSENGDPEACVIDCEQTGEIGFHLSAWGGGVTARIEGVKITGASTAIESHVSATALNNATVSAVNCIITGCSDVAVNTVGSHATATAYVYLRSCELSSNPGGAIHAGYDCTVKVYDCVFYDNGLVASLGSLADVLIDQCTLAGNGGGAYGVIRNCGAGCVASWVNLRKSIVAYNIGTPVVLSGCTVRIECCDVFGNSDGDFIGCLANKEGVDGNFSLDPAFCTYSGRDLRPRLDSPCSEGNHPFGADCGQIGAFPAGCGAQSLSNEYRAGTYTILR